MIGEAATQWLPALALAAFGLGTVMSALAWIRGKAPLAGVTVLCVLGLARQVALLTASGRASPLADAALVGMACAAIVALRAVRRTTRERNRAEDLHWDAMETVRTLTELAGTPSSDPSAKLARVLALGASRFHLERGFAWQAEGGSGRVIGRHPVDDDEGEPPPAPLERLALAARASRPLVLVDDSPSPDRVFFGAPLQLAGRTLGSLAFVGAREPRSRFSATDKDLLNLMAQWLAIELERARHPGEPAHGEAQPEPAAAPASAAREGTAAASPPTPAAPVRRVARGGAARKGDLNAAIRRSEARLRRRVGVDGRLELALGDDLPPARSGRVALPTLVESLVACAARLAPSGRIRIETTLAGDVQLAIQVEGEGIDESALACLSAPSPAGERGSLLGLPQLERLLRLEGGDLSLSLEPPRRAVITAFLPPLEREVAAPRSAPPPP